MKWAELPPICKEAGSLARTRCSVRPIVGRLLSTFLTGRLTDMVASRVSRCDSLARRVTLFGVIVLNIHTFGNLGGN